jgi:hypothetical protein
LGSLGRGNETIGVLMRKLGLFERASLWVKLAHGDIEKLFGRK